MLNQNTLLRIFAGFGLLLHIIWLVFPEMSNSALLVITPTLNILKEGLWDGGGGKMAVQ